jgi:hypothetical protein
LQFRYPSMTSFVIFIAGPSPDIISGGG